MKVSMKCPRSAIAVAALCLYAMPAAAVDQTWAKFHQQIEMDGVVFAEYTVIRTVGNVSPSSHRILYKDQQGVLLVIRMDAPFTLSDGAQVPTSTASSITKVDSGEQVTIAMPNSGQLTLTAGTGSLTTTDNDPVPSSVRQSAIAMLDANTSQAFRDALTRFALVATRYTPDYDSLAFALRGYFFPSVQVVTPHDYKTDLTDLIKNFDPSVNPPGSFEQPFEQAYYQ